MVLGELGGAAEKGVGRKRASGLEVRPVVPEERLRVDKGCWGLVVVPPKAARSLEALADL